MMNIQALLLCAGQGNRFDQTGRISKLLAELPSKKIVLGLALDSILPTFPHPLAVVRPEQAEVKQFLTNRGIELIEDADAKLGMGYSIAAGVRHSEQADGWLICLGDMPYVKAETIAQISATAIKHPDAIVAPFYQGKRGHPVFIPRSFKEDLLGLQKDEGPRHLMMNGPLIQVDTIDTGIYRDIDLPSDLT